MMTEQFPIPQILRVAELGRRTAQIASDGLLHRFTWSRGTSWSCAFLQAGKAAVLEAADPVLHRTDAVAEKLCHLGAAESMAYQENPMEAVIIPGFLRPQDLVLQRQPHDVRIADFQFAHGSLLSKTIVPKESIIRNYL
jgi:hypothetical protein